MTTPTIDRNEAFNATRREQIASVLSFNASIPAQLERARENAEKLRAANAERIASGKLVPAPQFGAGAYRVNDPSSYDNNEVVTLQQPRGLTEIQPLLLPLHGLDTSTGKAALYTRYPEWHTLGNVVPEGISDLREVLRLGGIDFEVGQKPALFRQPKTKFTPGGLIDVPGQFVNYRKDTGAPLGIVGRIYAPIPNAAAAAFLQDLVRKYSIVFESAGATYGGAHVFIGMRLPEDVILDLGDGVTDTIRPYIFWRNGHDGRTPASVIVTPWRIVCGNTERFAMDDALTQWRTRHTTNWGTDERLAEARKTLGLTVKHFDAFKAAEEALARTELAVRGFHEVLEDVYPKPGKDAGDRAKNTWADRKLVLDSMWKDSAAGLGKTAYAAERVFTDYLDHAAPRRAVGDKLAAARATAVVEGRDDDVKARVHKRLMLTVAA
jgi:phage/plasmid-like protein (TIGR03299 family)